MAIRFSFSRLMFHAPYLMDQTFLNMSETILSQYRIIHYDQTYEGFCGSPLLLRQ